MVFGHDERVAYTSHVRSLRPGRSLAVALPLLLAAGWSMLATGCGDGAGAAPSASCAASAVEALRQCAVGVNAALRSCYLDTGSRCPSGDPRVDDAFAALADDVRSACADDEAVRAAGFGPLFTVETLVERLESGCRAESAALAARSFGGPQGAALAGADGAGRACLGAAHEQATTFLDRATALRGDCITAVREGGACDPAMVESDVASAEGEAAASIAATCPALQDLIAVEPDDYVARAGLQAQCLTATASPDTTPLSVPCGPRAAVPTAPRGEWVQIVLDESVFGTRCGDGSPYAFQVRLAPAGSPVSDVVVGMEGGGVCVFEQDCANRPADLFEALSDPPFDLGPLSSDPSFNPFAEWTAVFLPYCTQDVFVGGGTTSDWPSVTVHRFGSVNVRAALRYVRDLVWRELDAETARGYRPDRMRVLFGGFSAGAFGTLYNYHYVLDDLQWEHTAAYPDAGLALDNGEALGVRGLGAIVISDSPPIGWGARSFLPPYCFDATCGIGPVMLEATAPRLEAVPEQQLLILSNQVDGVQVGTTFFPSTESWINELRASYCETRDLNGVHYYLPAIPESTHVISPRPNLYADHPVDGAILRDWLAGAFSDPSAVTSRVVEGNLVEAFPGVEPFPCPVAP